MNKDKAMFFRDLRLLVRCFGTERVRNSEYRVLKSLTLALAYEADLSALPEKIMKAAASSILMLLRFGYEEIEIRKAIDQFLLEFLNGKKIKEFSDLDFSSDGVLLGVVLPINPKKLIENDPYGHSRNDESFLGFGGASKLYLKALSETTLEPKILYFSYPKTPHTCSSCIEELKQEAEDLAFKLDKSLIGEALYLIYSAYFSIGVGGPNRIRSLGGEYFYFLETATMHSKGLDCRGLCISSRPGGFSVEPRRYPYDKRNEHRVGDFMVMTC